jgi:acyl carrier protein
MNNQEMFDTIIKTIASYVKDKELLETANEDTLLIEDLKINSARLMDILITFEDQFDVEITDDDLDDIKTIGHLMEAIRSKKEKVA